MIKHLDNGILVDASLSDIEEIVFNLGIQVMNTDDECGPAKIEIFHTLVECQEKIGKILDSLAPDLERTVEKDIAADDD